MEHADLPEDWDAALPIFAADSKGMATRDSSGKVLNAIAAHVPWLIGGSADLAPSTKTHLSGDQAGELEAATPGGRNLHFGVREHAMGAILNGLAVSGLRAFAATFLIFSDYMKPSIRLAALMELPVVYVFTHDSIGVGEDGPTHQPIEQLIGLRSIPDLLHPAPRRCQRSGGSLAHDLQAQEPAGLSGAEPTGPAHHRSVALCAGLGPRRGAYVLADSKGAAPEVILIGTGSEVALCLAVHAQLAHEGIKIRVVSMPSWELFEAQDQAYRDSVLPPDVAARVSVEMGSVIGWDRYVGPSGQRIGMRSFGASAPLKDLLGKFGFTVEAIAAAARDQLAKSRTRTAL